MRDNWDVAISRQTKRQRARPAYVSINRRGEIAMNDKAFKMIRCPYNVTILYLPPHGHTGTLPLADGELKGIIGVKFPIAQDPHCFAVRRYGRGGRMRIIRANSALRQFGIRIEQTLKFYNPPVVTYHNEPMLLLELDRAE
jgi:hypothetical protein